MRKAIFAAAAVALVLVIGAPAERATAMTAASPAALGLTTAGAGLVQQAAVHCRHPGCGRVWHHRYLGWPFPPFLVQGWIRFWAHWPPPPGWRGWRYHYRYRHHHR